MGQPAQILTSSLEFWNALCWGQWCSCCMRITLETKYLPRLQSSYSLMMPYCIEAAAWHWLYDIVVKNIAYALQCQEKSPAEDNKTVDTSSDTILYLRQLFRMGRASPLPRSRIYLWPFLQNPHLQQSNKVAKIRNRYNQVPHLTQDTNGKVTNS